MPIPAPTPSESPTKLGPVTETNLAWAEQRHAMLARLALLGMRLAEEIVERAISSPYHPELRHEPGRAYANAARAVRFSLVLQARVEQQIIAMRNGEPVPALISGKSSGPGISTPNLGEAPCAATDRETRDTEAAASALDRSRENLSESETYDDLLNRPMGETVEAICDDLGVAFEASLWSDEVAVDPADAKKSSAPDEALSDERPRPPVYPANTSDIALEGIPPRSKVTSREPERVSRRE
jgi:hypothetical protein